MKMIGKELAKSVYGELQKKIALLGERDITPQLVIVKSMDIDAVNNYIHQKVKRGKKVGVTVEVLELRENDFANMDKVKETILTINKSPDIHGIIFQKPGNIKIDEAMDYCIDLSKDVDGFLHGSLHKPPVYRGVMKVLEAIFKKSGKELISILNQKNLVLVGKGKTGGGTIICGLKQDGFDMDKLKIIDSKSSAEERAEFLKSADIIISAVGRTNPVDFHLFRKTSILIDIGVHFDSENKIMGDFHEDDIKDKVEHYTTTPGGIGALTVAYLMDNTVNSSLGKLSVKK
jgi:methylenetetrahydrofolate dehydrogenase (NADP+)/methenyltetrahydrofolate cyclohydrolase